jgi:phage tail protein X
MTVFNAAADDLEPKAADIKMPDVSAQQHTLDELGLCRG